MHDEPGFAHDVCGACAVTGLVVTTSGSTSAVPAVDRRELLADTLGELIRAGFVQYSAPVASVILMQRVWQGSGEDSVIVDSITIHTGGQARAVREGDGDGTSSWGPRRGSWSDVVAALVALPPPEEFVMVRVESRSAPPAALPEGLL